MANVQKLLETVTFASWFNPETVQWNEDLGFMQVDPATLSIQAVRLVGFAVPVGAYGSTDSVVWPITRYRDLPRVLQRPDRNLKGIGPRLHNTQQAYASNAGRPKTVGVYTADINTDPEHLLDLSTNQGNRAVRLARHGTRLARATLGSEDAVIDEIHASYGNADAVRMTIPPRSELRQLRHGISNPSGVPPQFVLIRNQNITMHKVGEVPSLW